MEAFASTLEELHDADVLLHVVDATSAHLEKQVHTVDEILVNLELKNIPTILVLNKTDLLNSTEADALSKRMGGIDISAIHPPSLTKLMERIEALIWPHSATRGT
jgi:GTP-binding protein HflX